MREPAVHVQLRAIRKNTAKEVSKMEATRAAFLARGAKGGLALVAGGGVLGLAEGTALASRPTDTGIAKLAATAELLAVDFYKRAIASKKFSGDELAYMAAALGNERAHYKALAGVLGYKAPRGLRFKYPSGSFASRRRIGKLGQALETAFVGAYMGAVVALKSNELKGVAARIGANESRHLSVLTNIATGAIVPAPALPKVFTAAQAKAALKPFLA
jgi:Ferritin-like domain